MESIKDKNVLIVGATGGIGRNTAKLLKQSGANLFLTARDANKLAVLALELGTDTPFWDSIDLRVQKDKFVTAEEAARSIWFLCQQPSSGVVSELVLQPFNHQAI